MDAAFLRQLVAVESAPANIESLPLRPQPSVTKTYPAVPQRDSTEIELARVSRPAPHTGSYQSGSATPVYFSRSQTPTLESRPASPVLDLDGGVEVLQNMWDPYMNRFRLLSACLINLANGMSDAASGPLLPYMEK